jgi:hypothetical protein
MQRATGEVQDLTNFDVRQSNQIFRSGQGIHPLDISRE